MEAAISCSVDAFTGIRIAVAYVTEGWIGMQIAIANSVHGRPDSALSSCKGICTARERLKSRHRDLVIGNERKNETVAQASSSFP